MLENPDLPEELIITRLQDEYGLPAALVEFLPLGYDVNTAVYRVETGEDAPYFLKLRKGPFDDITVTLPRFLHEQGNPAIIAPLPRRDGRLWGRLNAQYRMILYPFIEGQNGYRTALTERQWIDFGAALRQVHTAQPPPEISRGIPRETFDPRWREAVRAFQSQVDGSIYPEPVAAKLAAFMRLRSAEIRFVVERAADLAGELQARPPQFVLCHSDVHAGNILIAPEGAVYIVDWDAPIFAPKERDLQLIGGSAAWNDPQQAAWFYQGYGSADVDRTALAYYRYERVIWDIAAYCEQLLLSDEGGEDREQSYEYFASNFLPGHEIDFAREADSQT